MEGAEFVIDRDRLCDCEPRVEELSDAHNDLVDEIESLHREIADSWDREDTDVRAAIEFHEVAVALHNEAKEFTKDVETLVRKRPTGPLDTVIAFCPLLPLMIVRLGSLFVC